ENSYQRPLLLFPYACRAAHFFRRLFGPVFIESITRRSALLALHILGFSAPGKLPHNPSPFSPPSPTPIPLATTVRPRYNHLIPIVSVKTRTSGAVVTQRPRQGQCRCSSRKSLCSINPPSADLTFSPVFYY